MALVSMRELLDHAATHNYAIPAFNVNNLEQVQAIMEAAKETGAPVIMQASAGARKYAGEHFLKHLIQAAVESYPTIPVVMHQDHGQSPAVCQGAIDLGFSSVMMDGSLEADGKTIASYDYNIEVTQKVVSMAHKLGITVEGELGCLGSLETGEAGEEDGVGDRRRCRRAGRLAEAAPPTVLRHRVDALDRRHVGHARQLVPVEIGVAEPSIAQIQTALERMAQLPRDAAIDLLVRGAVRAARIAVVPLGPFECLCTVLLTGDRALDPCHRCLLSV